MATHVDFLLFWYPIKRAMLRRGVLQTAALAAARPLALLPLASASVPATCAGALRPTAPLLGNKGGTPKKKKSPFAIRRKAYGVSHALAFAPTTQWYYCPLCAEPKKEGEFCRREDCRQIKP